MAIGTRKYAKDLSASLKDQRQIIGELDLLADQTVDSRQQQFL